MNYRKAGNIFIICALLLLVAILFGSNYKLTSQTLQQTIEKDEDLKRVELAVYAMKDKKYSSLFHFVEDFKESILSYNENAKMKKMWSEIIYSDHTFLITKTSSYGWVKDHQLLLFISLIFLFTAGACCFIKSQQTHLPGIRNNSIFFDKLNARGWVGILLGTFLIGLYIVLYFAQSIFLVG